MEKEMAKEFTTIRMEISFKESGKMILN